jgi:hypothetical protein
MLQILTDIFTLIADPVYITLMMIIGVLLLVIRQLFKMLDTERNHVLDYIEQLNENTNCLGKLTTLIEILVNRKERQ